MPPLHDIAHVGHVEIRTPVPAESLEFFTRYLGLTENGSVGDSVFLRAWDDYENVTIKLTAHATSGIGRTTFRATSPEALQRRVAQIEAAGRGVGWQDGDPGYGPTYVFTDPDGHELGIYYESAWYRPPAELRPALKNQAQANPARGVSVRRLDHVNYLGVEVEPNRDYLRDTLGALVTEQIVLDDGSTAGSWTTFTNKGYDVVYTRDRTGTAGRLHHIAFATDTRETSPSNRACSSRPAPTSTPSSRPSSSTSTSPAATGSSSATRAPGSSSRPTGSRSTGPRRNAPRDRPGG
jgi:catechol 2,3-dioxygenase-like lactoylglutathione lyase family enzyme